MIAARFNVIYDAALAYLAAAAAVQKVEADGVGISVAVAADQGGEAEGAVAVALRRCLRLDSADLRARVLAELREELQRRRAAYVAALRAELDLELAPAVEASR